MSAIIKPMEPNLQITFKGVPEKLAHDIGHSLGELISALADGDHALDFRRMHRIIVTNDFAAELAELSKVTASRNPITHTNEEYAVAVAKILLLPRDSGIEILPVFSANVTAGLVSEDPSHYESETFRSTLHLLHHELCHVHDENKKIDAFPEVILKQRYEGKDIYIRPLAEVCWSEYIANRLSSSTAKINFATFMTSNFTNAIPRTKPLVNEEIRAYRIHDDLNRLLDYFDRHGGFLPKAAAYACGYLDGLGIPLRELSAEAEEMLNGSYFEETWGAMRTALTEMYSSYPEHWKSMSVYDPLAAAIEAYYEEIGLFLSNLPDGGVYVDVPFRPGTF